MLFLDGNNIYLGVKNLGWKVDYKKLRIYLKDKYNVTKAYYFIGYVQGNDRLYDDLKKSGYELIFKETFLDGKGAIKGNCDAELVLRAMIDYEKYEQAILLTSDGDFACLVEHLDKKGKLRMVLAPNYSNCSVLLRRASQNKISFMDMLKKKIAK